MTKSAFEHNIRISLAHHMIIPAIFLVILIILLSQIPVFNCLFPAAVSSSEDMSALYHNSRYINCRADSLHYAGYDYMIGGRVKGHYYYSLEDGKCTIYVLSCKYIQQYGEFPSTINDASFRVELVINDSNLHDLLSLMAGDMNWSYNGLSSVTSTVVVNELRYSPVPVAILGIFLVFALIFTLVHIVTIIIGLINPYHTAIYNNTLGRNSTVHIKQACRELMTDYKKTGGFYVTANYVIYANAPVSAIIPIDRISAFYSYSTLCGLPMRRHLAGTITFFIDGHAACHIHNLPPVLTDEVTHVFETSGITNGRAINTQSSTDNS